MNLRLVKHPEGAPATTSIHITLCSEETEKLREMWAGMGWRARLAEHELPAFLNALGQLCQWSIDERDRRREEDATDKTQAVEAGISRDVPEAG